MNKKEKALYDKKIEEQLNLLQKMSKLNVPNNIKLLDEETFLKVQKMTLDMKKNIEKRNKLTKGEE